MKASITIYMVLLSILGIAQIRIIDDQFAVRPFGRAISSKDVDKLFIGPVSKSKKPIKNIHTARMDTILSFKANRSSIEFLQTGDREFFSKAVIVDPDVTLSKGLCVGMKIEELARIFGYKGSLRKNEKIVVSDSSEYHYHVFSFEEGMLVRVVLDSGPD
jgi:hypothetical protein